MSTQKTQQKTARLSPAHKRLEAWVAAQLANPQPVGGRNNQMIQVVPRMLELGWDEDGIIQAWLDAYEVGDDKVAEIQKVVDNARRYVTRIGQQDSSHSARRQKVAHARLNGERWLPAILKDRWTQDEIIEAGGIFGVSPQNQKLTHLRLFSPTDTIWLGAVKQTGYDKITGRARCPQNFTLRSEWDQRVMTSHPLRDPEFISHCTFNPGAVSRCNAEVVARRYLVVESDTLGLDDIGAVFHWLNTNVSKLRAVVFSGRRSLHGWFDMPPIDDEIDLAEISALLAGLKCDPSTVRPSQPVRFAGTRRKDTQLIQSLLYIDLPHESPSRSTSADRI